MNVPARLLTALLVLTIAGSACSTTIGPSDIAGLPSDASSLLGTWTSSGSSGGSSCTDFQWAITSQTATSATGTISATCLGSVPLSGQGTAQIAGTTLQLNVVGSATLPGSVKCDITISGNATVDGDTIRIPYSGTTCLGPVSGTEVLKKNPAPAPAPAPPPSAAPVPAPVPPPAPPPAPPASEPWEACGSLVGDKAALVECVHDAINPGSSAARAFEVTKRVAWLLRGEGGGLLLKDGGENIISWQGRSFSISRICYPDGHIFKVISDAGDGGTNGASWQDNGFVEPKYYLPAIDPNSGG